MATQIRYQGNVIIVEPNGKVVGSKVLELRAAVLPQAVAYDDPRILINFKHVSKMSSSGLGVLMQARANVRSKNGRIGVIHVGKHIKNLLVVSRLSSLFEHFDSEAAGVSAFSM